MSNEGHRVFRVDPRVLRAQTSVERVIDFALLFQV